MSVELDLPSKLGELFNEACVDEMDRTFVDTNLGLHGRLDYLLHLYRNLSICIPDHRCVRKEVSDVRATESESYDAPKRASHNLTPQIRRMGNEYDSLTAIK